MDGVGLIEKKILIPVRGFKPLLKRGRATGDEGHHDAGRDTEVAS
jgi:hypothetical protein